MSQISGQDNLSYKIRKSYWQKVTLEIFVLTRVLWVTAVLTTALPREKSKLLETWTENQAEL